MCLTPISLKSPKKHGQTVPCGKCSECIGLKRDGWIKRLIVEATASYQTLFLTLTYDDEHLIYADETPVLYYRHLTLYFKKLRKHNFKFKYFAAGEYGEKSGRPHYHVIMFFEKDFNFIELEKHWEHGNVTTYVATEGMLRYVTKDMLKETDLFQDVPRVLRPHLLVSNGIGIDYVKKNAYWHSQYPYVRIKASLNGRVSNMPRYYRNKIFSDSERAIQASIIENNRRNADILSQNCDDKTLEELRRETQIYHQKVERLRKQQLSINHFNRKL